VTDARRRRRGSWVGRAIWFLLTLLLLAALAYFGYLGMEASHRLVNRHTRNADCSPPTTLGIAYQPINYAVEAQVALGDTGEFTCVAPGSAAGEELVSSDGVSLAAWYVPAASGIGPSGPTVVVAHGWTNNKSGVIETLPVFQARFNVVLFDFRNHGQSENSETTQGINEQHDVRAVLDWLEAAYAPQTVILWGQSMGGHTVANVAADDPRVDALILDSTHSSLTVPMTNRIERDGYPFAPIGTAAGVAGAFIRTGVDVTSDDPIGAIAQLGARPVLVLHAGADDTIPLADAEAMRDAAAAAGVNVRLEVCADAPHAEIIDTCPADYQRWVDEFLAPFVGG
jgi:uncharacterized protein